ncbi:hypothetical protein QTP70_005741 [Hemibagrus guttatus]|uniref:Reverse transcriptase domain-containing protein n=1 Tax=Hemibagrus guttatus TaxID=175788 RepID=A0AAE0RBL2_9TELE|nr:hypothetical protein QTP70_005741 [Hemibagrus guttatus]
MERLIWCKTSWTPGAVVVTSSIWLTGKDTVLKSGHGSPGMIYSIQVFSMTSMPDILTDQLHVAGVDHHDVGVHGPQERTMEGGIIPSTLTTKLEHLGLSPPLCQWISNFLTGRPQAVRMGRHVSASLTLSTGAPQGSVLSPLLYSLYTYNCVATTNSTTIIKLTDDTVVVRLTSDNNKTAYLEAVRNLENWCQRNNLLLNVSKTKELIVDFSTKQERNYQTPMINESPVERVDSFRYLSVHITQDLSWSCHINTW